jgi:hypothetical protein
VTLAILAQAEKEAAALPAEVRPRITLRQGDMRDFDLGQRFGLVYIPARPFLHVVWRHGSCGSSPGGAYE